MLSPLDGSCFSKMSALTTGSPLIQLLLKTCDSVRCHLIWKLDILLTKMARLKAFLSQRAGGGRQARVERCLDLIVNVSYNLFGVPQTVVFSITAVHIRVRQADKPQSKRNALKRKLSSTFLRSLFNFLAFCRKLDLSRTPSELRQLLKDFWVSYDTWLAACNNEPYGIKVGKIKDSRTYKRGTRKAHSSHPLFAETKHGGYQCGGNDFFWNPSLTELTERSFSDEHRVKNASHRASVPESVIDNPWQVLPYWCHENTDTED